MSSSSTSSLTITNAEASRSSPEVEGEKKDSKDRVKETDGGLRESGGGSAVLNEIGIPKGKEKKEEANPEEKKENPVKEKPTEEKPAPKREDDGYAPNLFYAYARRTDSDRPVNSLYILTFTSAFTASPLLSAIKSSFPESHFSRDAPQLFTFKGADTLEKAWKAERKPKLQELKSKWFFSPANTAQVLPLQDEKGWPIAPPSTLAASQSPAPSASPTRPTTASRTPSIKGKEKKTVGFADQLPSPTAPLDIAKLERNLDRVSKLMETNASQISSLSSYQETTYDTLASALSSSLEQIKTLTSSQQRLVQGQQRLVDACDELRRAMREREELWKGNVGFSSTASNVSCGHEVHKPPRKVGRRVVGYVYGEEQNGGVPAANGQQ